MQATKHLLILCLTFFSCSMISAQSKHDVFDTKVGITWLGVDYSKMKFVGPSSGWGKGGKKSTDDINDTYFLIWNRTISREMKSFRIDQAVNRLSISWHTEVTERINSKIN